MAERADARRNRRWVKVALGSLLVGALGSVSAWLIQGYGEREAALVKDLNLANAGSSTALPKWGRIVPVAQARAPTAVDKPTVNVAVALPSPRNASASAFTASALVVPSPAAASVFAAPSSNPSKSIAQAGAATPEPMELPSSTSANVAVQTAVLLPNQQRSAASGPTTRADHQSQTDLKARLAEPRPARAQTARAQTAQAQTAQAQTATSGATKVPADDELTLLEAPVKFPKRETQIASPNKLGLGFGPGGTAATGKSTPKPVEVKVKRGDSLYGILKSKGLPARVLPALLSVGKHGDRLKRIRPGQALAFYIDAKGRLERLDYRPDPLTTVSYRRDGSGFESAVKETPLDKHERSVTGAIESSLFLDGQRAGLSNRVIMQMAEIFGWDVDFALDLRNGDRFTVVYEELRKDGRKFRDGDILAAEFINRGRVFRAVRYVTPAGDTEYYTPEGRSMRKAFLRTPVRFARISSRFNLRRKHPVLHKVRAHRGVDYAAPTGTPIKATGAGRIEFLGRKGGYGKTVIIRHTGGKYSTLYAHMHRYAKRLRTGSAVKQGQTIGYVGKTGLATGPHLHYEFRVRGRHKDPLRVRLPKSLPIASKHKRSFQRQTRKFIARLNSTGATVAQND